MSLRLTAIVVRARARASWYRIVAPYRLHPEALYGYDGEPPYWLRADLAASREAAAQRLADEAEMTVAEYGERLDPVEDIRLVWVVPVVLTVHGDDEPECEDDDCNCRQDEGQYTEVAEGQPGAVAYWRWNW